MGNAETTAKVLQVQDLADPAGRGLENGFAKNDAFCMFNLQLEKSSVLG
ncbi:MAG: hypothetical protein JW950_02700 [Deltaproteobacteria bacterium]|nr:hypothetical protein [Deltaproteobacteria bacterium]